MTGVAGALAVLALLPGGCKPGERAGRTAPETPVQGELIAPAPAPVAPVAESVAAASAPPASAVPPLTTPPAQPSAAALTPAGGEPEEMIGEYLSVTFDRLASFEYEIPDQPLTNQVAEPLPPKEQIPAPVKALNNQRVALKGFMLPLKVEGGLITELLIMRDQSMCCYGTVPRINEWVSVRMASKGVKPVMDQAITLFGTLKVGEIYENGYLVGIYEMAGDKMAGPLDL
jgi:hypothetical protein